MHTKCNLIIDSCCDLPISVVDIEGVDLIEFSYIDGDKEYRDDLFQSLTPQEFYKHMREGATPSTSQIAQPIFDEAFTRAVETGVPTVFLCFSSELSGTYDAAMMARDRLLDQKPDAELYVVDTKLASIAEGFLVYEAIKQREKGLTAKEMVAWAEEARYYVNCLFMVDDLESLRRGGRIPASVAMAGAKLDVKPLLTFDLEGNLTLNGVARGRKKGIKQMVDFYQKHSDQKATNRRVVVGNSDCSKDADRLKELLSKHDESVLFLENSIGPVIGSHVGPDMLALVFWGGDRRKEASVADRIAKRVKGKE